MCTRIAEIVYAPIGYISDSIERAIANTTTDIKIKHVATTIFMAIIYTATYMWALSKTALPLSTALATSFVTGFAASLIFMLIITITISYIYNPNQQQ